MGSAYPESPFVQNANILKLKPLLLILKFHNLVLPNFSKEKKRKKRKVK